MTHGISNKTEVNVSDLIRQLTLSVRRLTSTLYDVAPSIKHREELVEVYRSLNNILDQLIKEDKDG